MKHTLNLIFEKSLLVEANLWSYSRKKFSQEIIFKDTDCSFPFKNSTADASYIKSLDVATLKVSLFNFDGLVYFVRCILYTVGGNIVKEFTSKKANSK